ncbi:MAG: IS1634 family transposase [Candidatus Sumerlaeota bacterium]|nr:IS1634 family transposase [Candidatus Sumerlaeota bacterium]
MASLDRIRKGNRSYWRIVESRRVNGKPRPVPVMYLGTADDLLKRLLGAEGGRLRLQSFQHGDVAALKAMANRLELVSIIDRHVRKSRHALSVGTTLLLAALNRAVEPRSKRAWASWAKGTSLARLFDIDCSRLTSQYFWDQMDLISLGAMEAIENELTIRIVKTFDVKLDLLFYDTTNFFTYIASTNTRSTLAKLGHSKQHRMDLRLFSLALLVSRHGHLPLCSRVYEGNRADAAQFPDSLTLVRQRLESLVNSVEDITLVYDRGNNSKANQALVDTAGLHYVAALTPSQHPDLLNIPTADYAPLGEGPLEGVRVHRLKKMVWGQERTLVLLISETLRAGQIRGLAQHLNQRVAKLQAWKEALAKPRSGARSPASAQKTIQALLKGQHIGKILKIRYRSRARGNKRLDWSVDEKEIQRLHEEQFGKQILMSDRHAWTTEEIIQAYRGQSHVEKTFRQIKDLDHLAVRPQFHWTDQKVRVHTFLCLLAYLLARLVELEARKAGWRDGLDALLNELADIRLAMVLRCAGPQGGRPRCEWQLEEADPEMRSIFGKLVPHAPPFMYTAEGDA